MLGPHLYRATFLASACVAFNAQAEDRSGFDPLSLREHVRGKPTQILVLATPHLSSLKSIDRADLEPLLQRLAAFKPSVIAIESLPGETLSALEAYAPVYPDVASQFGGLAMSLATLAKAEVRLSPAEAEAEARRLPPGPPSSASDRRRLAALFAAALDPSSALVQWLQLPPEQRRAGDGVSPELAQALDRYSTRRNENVLIGVDLAVRLGLNRLHAVDDQTDSDLAFARMADLEANWPRIQAALDNPEKRQVAQITSRAEEPGALLQAYRELNRGDTGRIDVKAQWEPLLRLDLPESLGRRRVIQWETRNLRMTANLREASADAPGGRVLMIVGSAHKPWIESYLSRMHDVEVVDASSVLGTER